MIVSWKKYTALQQKKRRYEAEKFIVEGVRLCSEAMLSDWEIETGFVTENFQNSEHWPQFDDTFRHRNILCRTLQPAQFKRIAGTETPQGILMVIRMPKISLERMNMRKAAFVIVLEGIRDPGNLGTLIRTADWYGANAVILSDDCVDPYNAKVLRSSMGSIFHLPVYISQDLPQDIKRLQENHFWVVAATVNSNKTLRKAHFKKPVAILLGNEARGLSPEVQRLSDMTVRIWKYGQAESLNVAIAGGVLMDHIAGAIF